MAVFIVVFGTTYLFNITSIIVIVVTGIRYLEK